MTNPSARPLDGVCVLVVDDYAPMRTAVRRFLDRAGCTVLEAATPSEAIGVARNHATPLDLALIDLVLPEMSGPECAEQLLEDRPELSVAYMSGYAESVSTGFAEDDTPVLLQKPFAQNELVDTIRRLLRMDVQSDLSFAVA